MFHRITFSVTRVPSVQTPEVHPNVRIHVAAHGRHMNMEVPLCNVENREVENYGVIAAHEIVHAFNADKLLDVVPAPPVTQTPAPSVTQSLATDAGGVSEECATLSDAIECKCDPVARPQRWSCRGAPRSRLATYTVGAMNQPRL